MKDGWVGIDSILYRREYGSYREYLTLQGSKLANKPGTVAKIDAGISGAVLKTVGAIREQLPASGNVLCLGARLGGEVEGFIAAGYFAVGIDINPGEGSRHVLLGDFHQLDFPDSSVDIIFTNSLDHVYDMKKLLGEVYRVLKPGGIFMTCNKGGVEEPVWRNAKSDGYDCMEWTELTKLCTYIEGQGFSIFHEFRAKGFTPHGRLFRKI